MGKNSKKYVFIPRDKLQGMIGKAVHVAALGVKYGCVWILKDVRNDRAILETPKTKKKNNVHVSKLCYTNRNKPAPAQDMLSVQGSTESSMLRE